MSGQLNRQLCGILATAGALGRACGLAAVVAASISASAGARAEDTLSIATWGGAYGQSQEIAFFEPFAKETGTKIATEIYDGTLAKIKEMIGGDESEVDVVDVSAATLGTLCSDGLLEPIEASSLGAAPGGESAEQDFYSGALSSCGVASVAWSTAIAFDRQAFSKNQPSQIAALLDTKRFPGKRALPDTARAIRSSLRCSPTGSIRRTSIPSLRRPPASTALFRRSTRSRATSFGGTMRKSRSPGCWRRRWSWQRAIAAASSAPPSATASEFGVIWDGQIYDLDLWAIPKSAKNKDGAKRFIIFATDPARLAAQAQLIAYGPMRKSALSLVGKHPVIDVEMTAFLPTAPDNFKKALKFDDAWWTAHDDELQKRFEEWRGPLSPGQGKPPTDVKPPEPVQPPTQALP